MWNCWPANEHAPYCGCQLITTDHDMINATCTAQFSGVNKVHMFSVASSYAIFEDSDSSIDKYVWTGYEGLSHENLHDIIYFFEPEACLDPTYDPAWYNITMPEADFKPTITCVDYCTYNPTGSHTGSRKGTENLFYFIISGWSR